MQRMPPKKDYLVSLALTVVFHLATSTADSKQHQAAVTARIAIACQGQVEKEDMGFKVNSCPGDPNPKNKNTLDTHWTRCIPSKCRNFLVRVCVSNMRRTIVLYHQVGMQW